MLSASQAGNMSIWFDVAGLLGGIAAGVASDYTGASATTTGWSCIPILCICVWNILKWFNFFFFAVHFLL